MNTLRGIFPEPKTVPKRNFILENKRNLKYTIQDRNSAHLSKSGEYKKCAVSQQQLDKLKVTGNRSAPFKSSAPSLGNKIKPISAQPLRRKTPFNFSANSNTNSNHNLKQNQNNESTSSQSKQSPRKNASESDIETDPIRSLSPDYTKFISTNSDQTKSFTSKAMQTIDINDSAALLHNSVIRYPSCESTRTKNPTLMNNLAVHKNEVFQISALNNLKLKSTDDDSNNKVGDCDGNKKQNITSDFCKLNKKSPDKNIEAEKIDKESNKTVKVLKSPKFLSNKEPVDPLKPPPSYQRGVLPRYLRNRNNMSCNNANSQCDIDENCPEGHVTLPESERKETLGVLRNRFAELVSELNRMPVRSDTLRQKKRKMELEEELVKLEDGIKVFSRPRVYVKIA